MPLVRCMQIYASLMTVQRQLYPIVSEDHCVYIHLVGLIRVARFAEQGNATPFTLWNERQALAPRFFSVWDKYNKCIIEVIGAFTLR